MKEYLITNRFNWLIVSNGPNDMIYTMFLRTSRQGDFFTFYYYPSTSRMRISDLNLYCTSIDEANEIVDRVFMVNNCEIPDEHKGRMFKLNKLKDSMSKLTQTL